MGVAIVRSHETSFVKRKRENTPGTLGIEVTWEEPSIVVWRVKGGIQREMSLAHPLKRQLDNQRTESTGLRG